MIHLEFVTSNERNIDITSNTVYQFYQTDFICRGRDSLKMLSSENGSLNEKEITGEVAEETNNDIGSSKPLANVSDRTILLRYGYVLQDEKILGEGTYSKVKKAYSSTLRKDVAIKIVNRRNAPKDFLKRFFPRELNIIRMLKHENICQFYEILDTCSKVFIAMEYANKGDLLEYVQRNRYMVEAAARKLFLQVRVSVSIKVGLVPNYLYTKKNSEKATTLSKKCFSQRALETY